MSFILFACFFLMEIHNSLAVSISIASSNSNSFGYNYFSRSNGQNVTLPTTRSLAESNGWFLTDRDNSIGAGDNVNDKYNCIMGLGIEYTEGSKTHSKSRPLSLFFDDSPDGNGQLSAFSVRAWFSNESYFNPTTWQLPPFGNLDINKNGNGDESVHERWVTITTRDPHTICKGKHGGGFANGIDRSSGSSTREQSMLGDRLLLNVLNSEAELETESESESKSDFDWFSIPTVVPSVPDGAWKFG